MQDILKKPFRLQNTIQHYKWGSVPPDALIPQLLGIAGKENTTYAELWMGAHSSGSSKIYIENELLPLNDLIHRFPGLILGDEVARRFDNKLPFLLKVLSAAETLSIQTHPSRGQAELLHRNDPRHYPDTNHKPEIAIALDSLTALAGFITYRQCQQTIRQYPEMADFFGSDALGDIFPAGRLSRKLQSAKLRQLYQTFIHLTQTKPGLYQENVDALARRLRSKKGRRSRRENLFLNALDKYGNSDVGLFSLFFLRMLTLKAGEAICITPGVPHVYLKGNIVECMANSDNVVRAGLTPKFQDIQTLMTILDYTPNSVQITRPVQKNNEYSYPVFTPEFEISRLELPGGSQTLRTGNRVEIFLIIEGTGTLTWNSGNSGEKISKGQSYLIPGILDSYTIAAAVPMTIYRVRIP